MLLFINITYFLFHILWGINYYRAPFYKKLNLSVDLNIKKDTDELYDLANILIKKCIKLRSSLKEDPNGIFTYEIPPSVELLKKGFIYLSDMKIIDKPLEHICFKPSFFSSLLKYSSISGYYNPFSFEAQINFNFPKTTIPFTLAHEISHQIGIAKEDEANFMGFLVSVYSSDPIYQYSAYYTALKYILNAMDQQDIQKLITLSPSIKRDIENEQSFFKKNKSPFTYITSYFNDIFLKLNGQKKGRKTYHQFVNLLLSLYKKEIEKKTNLKKIFFIF